MSCVGKARGQMHAKGTADCIFWTASKLCELWIHAHFGLVLQRVQIKLNRMRPPMAFPKVASRLSAQKVSLDSQNVALLGWDLEAMLSDGGILLLSPFLQWDREQA